MRSGPDGTKFVKTNRVNGSHIPLLPDIVLFSILFRFANLSKIKSPLEVGRYEGKLFGLCLVLQTWKTLIKQKRFGRPGRVCIMLSALMYSAWKNSS